MTSCFTSRSISSIRATSNVGVAALLPDRLGGRLLRDDARARPCASAACASISNQMRNRVSGDQIAVISGRE